MALCALTRSLPIRTKLLSIQRLCKTAIQQIRNNPKISKGSSSSHLPRRLDLGITYYPFEQLVTTFAMERVLGYDESSFRFGIEYELNSSFLIRTGIQLNPNRLGAGFSYKIKNLELSYSLLTHSVLPVTDIFNLRVHFE